MVGIMVSPNPCNENPDKHRTMTNEAYKYDYLRYNVHGVLRPNLLLKLILLFLCRHIAMLLLIVIVIERNSFRSDLLFQIINGSKTIHTSEFR